MHVNDFRRPDVSLHSIMNFRKCYLIRGRINIKLNLMLSLETAAVLNRRTSQRGPEFRRRVQAP